MYISARERQVLEILLTETGELTVKDLADQIGVSGRTIHRDLKNVEDILEEYNLTLQKKSGVGIHVTGDKSKIRELELFLFNLYHTEYTPNERQTMILCTLLESNEPVKLHGLANDLNVTIATVSNDLTKMEVSLKKFELSLIRRRGYGVEIEGSESAKRRAMRSLISEYLDESEILSLAKENIQRRSNQQINTVSEKLLGLVEKKKLLIVENVVETLSHGLPFSMADSAYIGLVVHLALAVERIQKGEGISIDPSYLENQKSAKEYLFAEKIVEQLENIFQIKIPEAEIGYITMHLKGAKLRHDNEYLVESSSLQVAIKTRNLIDIAGNLLGRDLTANRSLFEGLMMHLKPALYRIKQNMGISNPLLDKIKSDYGELFSIVKEAVKQVFHEFNVPDEEIGYLVMHFGAVILGNKELANLNTLVICPSGIGTSKMLATRLQKEFPELTPIRNVSVREFKKMNTRDYDLVISTIPIPDFHLDYILVSPILNNNEVDKVRSFIGEIRKARSLEKKQELVVKETLNKKSAMKLAKEMDLVSEMAQTISLILSGFETKEVQGKLTTREILTQACQELFAKQRINGIEEVVYSIMEREKLGGLGIPTTAMALYHARSAHVLLPSFTIYMMQNPIKVQGMDNTLMEMKCLILLLAPGTASEGAMEILSFLSSLLIESEESMAFFQSNDQGKITVFLTAKLDQFFDEKLVEIRSV
jgi:mannitol operon transcriptional antiterminator